MGSTATGVNRGKIGQRLTNLTQLTIDTSWWTRYRDDSHNPDLDPNHVFPQAVPTLAVNRHTAIPRTDADTSDPNFLQAIANTAAFHFPTIEQGGSSLYPSLAQRATDVEVLRILMSIGPTETMHFQTWSDVAGNAPPLTAVDPVTGVSVTFPDLEVENELLDKALIMPEPCPFLSRSLPIVSIIRPTKTQGAAMGALQFLSRHGSFHRPIARVFRVYDPTGTSKPTRHRGEFRDTRRLNTSEAKVRVRTPAFGLRIGRFISASASLCSDAWRTDFFFRESAFRTNCPLFR